MEYNGGISKKEIVCQERLEKSGSHKLAFAKVARVPQLNPIRLQFRWVATVACHLVKIDEFIHEFVDVFLEGRFCTDFKVLNP